MSEKRTVNFQVGDIEATNSKKPGKNPGCASLIYKMLRQGLLNGHDYFADLAIGFHIALGVCNFFKRERFIDDRFQFAGS